MLRPLQVAAALPGGTRSALSAAASQRRRSAARRMDSPSRIWRSPERRISGSAARVAPLRSDARGDRGAVATGAERLTVDLEALPLALQALVQDADGGFCGATALRSAEFWRAAAL